MIRLETNEKDVNRILKKFDNFEKFPNEVQEDLEDFAVDSVNEIKERAPVDTGRLRQKVGFVPGKLSVQVSSEAFQGKTDYAPIQEYGSRFRPARPYFWPVVRKNYRGLLASLRRRLKNKTK